MSLSLHIKYLEEILCNVSEARVDRAAFSFKVSETQTCLVDHCLQWLGILDCCKWEAAVPHEPLRWAPVLTVHLQMLLISRQTSACDIVRCQQWVSITKFFVNVHLLQLKCINSTNNRCRLGIIFTSLLSCCALEEIGEGSKMRLFPIRQPVTSR